MQRNVPRYSVRAPRGTRVRSFDSALQALAFVGQQMENGTGFEINAPDGTPISLVDLAQAASCAAWGQPIR